MLLLVASLLVDAPPAHVLTGHRWEGSLSVDGAPMQGFNMNGLTGDSVGIGVTFGRQLGPLRLSVEYGLAKLWAEGWSEFGGELERFGATARFRATIDEDISVGAYAEIGAGYEQLRWTGGGNLGRRDAEAGVGFETAGGTRRMVGMDVGARVLATATPDGTHDLAVLIHVGVLFGI